MCGAEVVWEISVSSKFCYELKAALKNKVYWKKKKKRWCLSQTIAMGMERHGQMFNSLGDSKHDMEKRRGEFLNLIL